MIEKKPPNPLREKLAELERSIYNHWLSYMLSPACGTFNPDGSFTINAEKVERWRRQMNTPYDQLTEKEKNSDREQAEKVIDVLAQNDQ